MVLFKSVKSVRIPPALRLLPIGLHVTRVLAVEAETTTPKNKTKKNNQPRALKVK